MEHRNVYFDNNATTQPTPAVVEAVHRALTEFWHNPSSVHRPGQAARQQVELARQSIARLIGARPRDITFTSGGTEAIDTAIRGVLAARPRPAGGIVDEPPVILTTAIEHAAVRDLADELERSGAAAVERAPVGPGGVVDAAAFSARLTDRTAIAVLQWANNETGAIQPAVEVARICRERRVPMLCDATQWVGKLPVEPVADERGQSMPPFDLMAFAPHKFHGPKGIGVLYARPGVRFRPRLLGSQELGRRGGTENVPGILGAGVAAAEAQTWLTEQAGERGRLAALRDRFEAAVLSGVPDAVVNGPRDAAARLWNTTNLGFPGLEAEAILLLLSERGVCASAGAASSSGSLEPSHVLLAMGIDPKVAHGSVRFSLSRLSSHEEVDRAAAAVVECIGRLRALSPA